MKFKDLPFVTPDNNWDVTATGDHAADCTTGRNYFRKLLGAIHLAGHNPILLPRVIEAQVKAGKWTGIEIGFHAALADEVAAY